MGVGTPVNILESIALGVDMLDCVMPTRNGRNGMLFTQNGTINIKNAKWKDDFSVIDENGTSFVDKQYSKAYLNHLFAAKEMLAAMIASVPSPPSRYSSRIIVICFILFLNLNYYLLIYYEA